MNLWAFFILGLKSEEPFIIGLDWRSINGSAHATGNAVFTRIWFVAITTSSNYVAIDML